MLRKKSVMVLLAILAILVILPACDSLNRKSESPVGPISVTDTLTAMISNPFPLLPNPPGAKEEKQIVLSVGEFEKIISSIDKPFSPVGEKGEKPQLIGGLNSACIFLNSRIVIHAYGERGWKCGLQCKPYVTQLVYQETGKWLPATASIGCGSCGYYWDYKPSVCQGWRAPIELIVPGQIIQMWWNGNYNPHTAICIGVSSGGMYWIDSNFVASLTVGLSWIPWSYFHSKTGDYYYIYQVIP